MPQLHLYVPDAVAKTLREQAKARNMSLSRYLAEIVQSETGTCWPEGYFDDVIGGWQGERLERPEQPQLQERELF